MPKSDFSLPFKGDKVLPCANDRECVELSGSVSLDPEQEYMKTFSCTLAQKHGALLTKSTKYFLKSVTIATKVIIPNLGILQIKY